jgi:hypothetical protein
MFKIRFFFFKVRICFLEGPEVDSIRIETCCPRTIINIIKLCCVWLIHHCIFVYVLNTSGCQTLKIVSAVLGHFTARKENLYSYMGPGGSEGWSGWVRKVLPPSVFNSRTVQPLASLYTDYKILSHNYTENSLTKHESWSKSIQALSGNL